MASKLVIAMAMWKSCLIATPTFAKPLQPSRRVYYYNAISIGMILLKKKKPQ